MFAFDHKNKAMLIHIIGSIQWYKVCLAKGYKRKSTSFVYNTLFAGKATLYPTKSQTIAKFKALFIRFHIN